MCPDRQRLRQSGSLVGHPLGDPQGLAAAEADVFGAAAWDRRRHPDDPAVRAMDPEPVAAFTLGAPIVARLHWNADGAVARLPSRCVRFDDLSSEFMAKDSTNRDVERAGLRGMQVGAADAAEGNAQYDVPRPGLRHCRSSICSGCPGGLPAGPSRAWDVTIVTDCIGQAAALHDCSGLKLRIGPAGTKNARFSSGFPSRSRFGHRLHRTLQIVELRSDYELGASLSQAHGVASDCHHLPAGYRLATPYR
jgi:hypothetical protein